MLFSRRCNFSVWLWDKWGEPFLHHNGTKATNKNRKLCALCVLVLNFVCSRVALRMLFLILFFPLRLLAQNHSVDFRFAPKNYLAAICLPDDWQKTPVTATGALAYDFGPGPYARTLTEISIDLKDKDMKLVRQRFVEPRVPITLTEYSADGVSIAVSAFALVRNTSTATSNTFLNEKAQRLGGLSGCLGWATPTGVVDPAFRNVAWGTNRPIKYRIKIEPGSRRQVALGVIEPYKRNPHMRDLELRVEGATPQRVDPLRDGKNNQPYVYLFAAADANRDGWLQIESHTPLDSPDPNTTLSAIWIFPENFAVAPEAVIRGELSAQAEAYWDCGREAELQSSTPRYDAMYAVLHGNDFTPIIRIKSRRQFQLNFNTGTLTAEGRPFLFSQPRAMRASQQGDDWILEFPAGTKEISAIVQSGDGTINTMPNLKNEMQKARAFWLQQTKFPYGKIIVPDSAIQYLLECSIRNIYQIRETVDGAPEFHPGLSVYRGLWMDGASYQTMALLMLGDTASARRSIEGMMRYQQPSGLMQIMVPYPMYRETPMLVYHMCRFAKVAGDKKWLERNWERVERGLEFLWKLHEQTLVDSSAAAFGLFPSSFLDGGRGELAPEYSTVYWGLIGLRAAAETAQWLNKREQAEIWRRHAEELMNYFRRAVRRDMRQDREGNFYLPMIVNDTSRTASPQKANWGIFEAQGFGHLFAVDDPLVAGTMNLFRREKKQGLTIDTGWLKNGVWPFLGSMQALTHLYQREYREAFDLLYTVANHASPLGTWVEEQWPQELGDRTAGDHSNATSSAFFIKHIRRMLAFERGDTLELLAGVTEEWLKPGAKIELNDVPTLFGRLQLRLHISPDGKWCRLHLHPIGPAGDAGAPIILLGALRRLGYRASDGTNVAEQTKWQWGKKLKLVLQKE